MTNLTATATTTMSAISADAKAMQDIDRLFGTSLDDYKTTKATTTTAKAFVTLTKKDMLAYKPIPAKVRDYLKTITGTFSFDHCLAGYCLVLTLWSKSAGYRYYVVRYSDCKSAQYDSIKLAKAAALQYAALCSKTALAVQDEPTSGDMDTDKA